MRPNPFELQPDAEPEPTPVLPEPDLGLVGKIVDIMDGTREPTIAGEQAVQKQYAPKEDSEKEYQGN